MIPAMISKTKAKTKPRAKRLSPQERERIETLFARFEAANVHPRTELHFSNPYTLLVAVVLSAQATDKGVNKAVEPLFKKADNPADMLSLGLESVTDHIKSIGLYRNKAKNVIALSQILIDQHGGQVPTDRASLEALPGVGRKTAGVVLNELDIEPAIAVDTHVYRVAHRLKLANGKTPDKVEAQLMAVVPERALTRAHHWLILQGRYICVARSPKCSLCLIADLCPSKDLF
jgi:endonuclease-3